MWTPEFHLGDIFPKGWTPQFRPRDVQKALRTPQFRTVCGCTDRGVQLDGWCSQTPVWFGLIDPLVNLIHQLVSDIKIEGPLTRKQLKRARRLREAVGNRRRHRRRPAQTCKKKMVRWLAAAFTEMNESFQSTVVHAWDETELSRAWEKQVQTEALVKASSLFPNLATVNGGGGSQMATVVSIGARPVPAEDPTNELDPDAEYEGAPFVEATGEDGEGVPDWFEDGEETGSEL